MGNDAAAAFLCRQRRRRTVWDCRLLLSIPKVTDPCAMGAIGLDLSEFENPAPTRTPTLTVPPVLSARSPSPSAAEDENLKDHPPLSRSRKRKLPYRADVVVEGRRYKGKRVSRGEAELDVEALGLRDESDDYANQEERDDLSADEADSDLSDLRDDIEEEENIEVEAENERDRRVVSGRAERLQAEEKAVAARLAQEEKKDIARALAVRKQKVSTIPEVLPQSKRCLQLCS